MRRRSGLSHSAVATRLGSYGMGIMKPSKALLRQKRPNGAKLTGIHEAAEQIVSRLLEEGPLAEALVSEASVHRPRRSRVWVASFTGPSGGQMWRSTGLTDRNQALLVAKRWEAEARAQRVAAGRITAKPTLRVGRREPGSSGPLSQREVALLLGISERAVRLIERRAFRKLFNHPSLRHIWRQYVGGELNEHQANLSPEEVDALFKLARTPQEWHLLVKVTRLIRR